MRCIKNGLLEKLGNIEKLGNLKIQKLGRETLSRRKGSPSPDPTLPKDFKKDRYALMKHWVSLGLSIVLIIFVLGVAYVTPPVGTILAGKPLTVTRWEKGQGKVARAVGPGESEWLKLEKVSFHTIHAVVTAEDARFFQHSGLDWHEIWESFSYNWQQGRYARGASTITQQVVKLLFLENDKNLMRKIREASGALLLEWYCEKNTILEWYLNLVDFGSGVYGIKQAAQYYFATDPQLLTIPQSILLASVIPSPNRWSNSLRDKKLTPVGQQRFRAILARMRSEGFVNQRQCRIAQLTGNFGSPVEGESVCE
jgi:monofunctional biosynthetic peptidoglycan transglycosylase